MRLAERLHLLIFTSRADGVEGLNVCYCAGWLIPLLMDPGYLTRSPYLKAVGEVLTPLQAVALLSGLLVFWTGLYLFGSPPSGAINDAGDLHRSTKWRLAGLTLGIVLWSTLGYLLTSKGVNFGTFALYGQSGACTWAMWRLAWTIGVDRLAMEEKERRKRDAEKKMVSINGNMGGGLGIASNTTASP